MSQGEPTGDWVSLTGWLGAPWGLGRGSDATFRRVLIFGVDDHLIAKSLPRRSHRGDMEPHDTGGTIHPGLNSIAPALEHQEGQEEMEHGRVARTPPAIPLH